MLLCCFYDTMRNHIAGYGFLPRVNVYTVCMLILIEWEKENSEMLKWWNVCLNCAVTNTLLSKRLISWTENIWNQLKILYLIGGVPYMQVQPLAPLISLIHSLNKTCYKFHFYTVQATVNNSATLWIRRRYWRATTLATQTRHIPFLNV